MPRYVRRSKMPQVSMFRYFRAKWPRGVAPRPPNCIPENKESLLAVVSTVVAGPLPGLLASGAQRLKETAERELFITREAALRGELLEAEMRFERGEITEAEYQERVAELKRGLEEIGVKIDEEGWRI